MDNTINLDFGGSQFHPEDQEALRYILDSNLNHIIKPMIGELGSWTGRSTSILAEYCINRRGGKVYAIDTWEGSEGTNLKEMAEQNDVFFIFKQNMKSLNFLEVLETLRLPSVEAVNFFPDATFDLFFIDADHRYDFIKQDIELWLPKVKPGGILCGHDFDGFEYDEKYINYDYVNKKHHGVIKAVTEKFISIHKNSNIWWIKKGL